jgi:hypothetical protein
VNATEALRSYIERLQARFRLGAIARGAAMLASIALAATVLLAMITSRFAFSSGSLWSARSVLVVLLTVGAALGLGRPLWHWSRRGWTRRAERVFPQFEQRLLTFTERDSAQETDPFLELLAADTLRIAQATDVEAAAPDGMLKALFGVGALALATLLWLILATPGYVGYGASALWTGLPATPFYRVHVTPGDALVRRHADQLVTAVLPGLQSRPLRIHVHYQGASKWEETAMQPRLAGDEFQFLFAGIPEDLEYYVDAGPVQTRHFHLRVLDIPVVKQIRVTYHHPEWMHLGDTVEEHGGDLRAIEGTEAQLEIVTDGPLTNGVLALEDGRQIPLSAGLGNMSHGVIKVEKDGSYHVAIRDSTHVERISEDYLIAASAVKPPEVVLVRPERDYRASPIEEVTLAAKATDPFGLSELTLHYSVNGGPEQTVNMLDSSQSGAAQASGTTLLNLETLKLVPGDVVGFYATAKDARAEAHTDIGFIQVDPFEREFSQSQQMGAPGGGGGVADDQAQTAAREKEIIAATWKQAGQKNGAAREAAEQAKFLADVQNTLRSQALSLAGRLEMRDLQLANEQFGSFQQDMQAAATAMRPAAEKLDQQQWNAAVFDEQKALQYLLRAEATFRQIQVAFGSSGGGSGAVNSAGRDLASLFDLELDMQKNTYESAQAPASPAQHSGPVDDALKKLDELARRQSELAARHNSGTEQAAEERWQQEMLRRKLEELQHQLEQFARSQEQSGASDNGRQANRGQSSGGQSGGSPAHGGQSSGGQSGGSPARGGQSGGGESNDGASGDSRSSDDQTALAASGDGNSAHDRRVAGNVSSASSAGRPDASSSNRRDGEAHTSAQQALNRLREAEDAMRRAVDGLSPEDARRAADRLRDAMNLLGGIQQEDASRQLDAAAHEAGRLENQQHEQADRLRALMSARSGAQGSAGAPRMGGNEGGAAVESLIKDRQRLADDLARLTADIRAAERAAAERDRNSAKKLREAVADLEQADTETQLQRSADQLRRGYAPLSDSGEMEIAAALAHLKDQLGQARQTLADAPGRPSSEDGGLEVLDRLRSRLAALDPNRRGWSDGTSNTGRNGENTAADRGLRRDNARNDATGQWAGPVGRSDLGGNRGGPVNGGWNTGNNSQLPRPVAPDRSATPADTERVIEQGLRDLDQLRRSVADDPAARPQVDDLIRSMQNLDPRRFPGNPAMVNELYERVLSGVDKLELQLHHEPDAASPGEVRSDSPQPIPAGYEAAVGEYFRRLSRNP